MNRSCSWLGVPLMTRSEILNHCRLTWFAIGFHPEGAIWIRNKLSPSWNPNGTAWIRRFRLFVVPGAAVVVRDSAVEGEDVAI